MEEEEVACQGPAVAKVLGADDLLSEILLRLGDNPATLVRVALVSRRWLRHASDPAFLRRFRARHAPRALGLYVTTDWPETATRFVPVATASPELDAAVRRVAAFDLLPSGTGRSAVWTSGNGRAIAVANWVAMLQSPLDPARETIKIPAFPDMPGEDEFGSFGYLLDDSGGGDGLSPCSVFGTRRVPTAGDEPGNLVHVYALQYQGGSGGGAHWALVLVGGNKVRMAATVSGAPTMALLDLSSSAFSFVNLPVNESVDDIEATVLSPANDGTGVYLIDLNRSQLRLRVWLHRFGADWSLVNTISLRQWAAPATTPASACCGKRPFIKLWEAFGFDGEAVVLEIGTGVLYLRWTSGAERRRRCTRQQGIRGRELDRFLEGEIFHHGLASKEEEEEGSRDHDE